ncbi:MAG: hypothetical protein ABIM54_00960 [candidate division WOR-3 bacterium]
MKPIEEIIKALEERLKNPEIQKEKMVYDALDYVERLEYIFKELGWENLLVHIQWIKGILNKKIQEIGK